MVKPANKPGAAGLPTGELVLVEREDGSTVEFHAYRVLQDAAHGHGSRFDQGETLAEVLVLAVPAVDTIPVGSSRRRRGGLL